MEHAYIWFAIFVAILVWLVYEIRRAPIEDFDRSEYEQDAADADECIAASRPAGLEAYTQRPHIRGNTAYGKEVK